ncbi:MAG TPA: hypothetical protein VE570_14595 [Thermoleophilaceae bacterium]|nr:hypothetical protein [Thermoleophilaceae bacterium]
MSQIPKSVVAHVRGNVIAYVALFAALGGTSYAAVKLEPGSVRTAALARGAVTHSKLAGNSVTQRNIVKGSLTASAFKSGVLGGTKGAPGGNGTPGATGPAGANGTGSVVLKTQGTGSVTAPHGAATSIPLGASSWSQAGNELNLIAGAVTLKTPATCTGSFGNSVLINVDGATTTFAVAPTAPANATVTVPIAVGSLMEPGNTSPHQVTASLANSCTKDGEDFTVTGLKLDVLSFH